MNRGSGATNGKAKSSNEAVVLTLRKRFSSVRRKRTKSMGPGVEVSENLFNADPSLSPLIDVAAPSAASSHEDLRRNPWMSDSMLARSNSLPQPNRHLAHRLSFDDGSGVITLPDDADWLMEDVDDSDSEEDYGSTSPAVSATTEDESRVAAPGVDGEALANASSSSALLTSTPVSSPTKQRHGTYYHHPEKRKQTIPGAFPRSLK